VDIWPKMSLCQVGGRKLIAYFTGYAQHRRRFRADDVEKALRGMRPDANLASPEWRNEIGRVKNENAHAGMWEAELRPPRGPAELAVFDVDRGAVKWTYNCSERHPSIPANEFWTYLDKTAMVTAGKWTVIGWVDLGGEEAVLRLLAFDLSADAPAPVEKEIGLGFPSEGNRKSALFDLIAADETLYALVTQSDRLWVRDPRWKAQHVLAVRAGKTRQSALRANWKGAER
jgi:hypothetical protein